MKLLRAYIGESLNEEPVRLQAPKKVEKEMLREYVAFVNALKDAQAKLAKIKASFKKQVSDVEGKTPYRASFTATGSDVEKRVIAWFHEKMGGLEASVGKFLEATVRIDGVLISLRREQVKGSMGWKPVLEEVLDSLGPEARVVADAIVDKHEELVATVGKAKTTFDVVEEGVMDTLKGWISSIGSWMKRVTSSANRGAAKLNAIADRYE